MSCFHNLREGHRAPARPGSPRVSPGVNAMLRGHAGAALESPVHAHANEQWGVCLEGEWIRIQDGVEHH
jgi:hypothetical protein